MANSSKLNNYSSRVIGFTQALGVALYILLFALTVTNLEAWLPKPPVALAIASFLIAFIISALVCGSLMLGYPILLVLNGKIRRAIEIIIWSGLSLFFILVLVMVTLIAAK